MLLFSSSRSSLLIASLLALCLLQVVVSSAEEHADSDYDDTDSDDNDESAEDKDDIKIPYHDGTTLILVKGESLTNKLSSPTNKLYVLSVEPARNTLPNNEPDTSNVKTIEVTQDFAGTDRNIKIIFERETENFKLSTGSLVYSTLQPVELGESDIEFKNLVESVVIIKDNDDNIMPNNLFYSLFLKAMLKEDEDEIEVHVYPNGQKW